MQRRYTDEQRRKLIREVRAGRSVKHVAERMGVGVSTAYLWINATSSVPATPTFARVVPAQAVAGAAMVLEVGSVSLRLEAGFDPELLREVVGALRDAQ